MKILSKFVERFIWKTCLCCDNIETEGNILQKQVDTGGEIVHNGDKNKKGLNSSCPQPSKRQEAG